MTTRLIFLRVPDYKSTITLCSSFGQRVEHTLLGVRLVSVTFGLGRIFLDEPLRRTGSSSRFGGRKESRLSGEETVGVVVKVGAGIGGKNRGVSVKVRTCKGEGSHVEVSDGIPGEKKTVSASHGPLLLRKLEFHREPSLVSVSQMSSVRDFRMQSSYRLSFEPQDSVLILDKPSSNPSSSPC